MQTFLLAILGAFGFIVFLLAVYVVGNWLAARFRKPRSHSAEYTLTYNQRLRNPKWAELEEHFGRAIPEAIKNLYSESELLNRRDILFRGENGTEWRVAEFLPADVKTLDHLWPDVKESKNFVFARDSFGDCYYVPLPESPSDGCVVMYYHHDGNDVELVSRSLETFLGWSENRSS